MESWKHGAGRRCEAGEESRIRPWGSAKAHEGNEVLESVEPPWEAKANTSKVLLTDASIPHSLQRKLSFRGLQLKGHSPPPTAFCLCFPPCGEERRKKRLRKQRKGLSQLPFLGYQSFVGGEEVSWGEPGGVEEGPKLLVEKLKSFHFYSNIINTMGKSHFTCFLINNLDTECSFVCCVPLLCPAPLIPHTSLIVYLVTSNLGSLGFFFFPLFFLDQFKMIVWEAHKICRELQKSPQ